MRLSAAWAAAGKEPARSGKGWGWRRRDYRGGAGNRAAGEPGLPGLGLPGAAGEFPGADLPGVHGAVDSGERRRYGALRADGGGTEPAFPAIQEHLNQSPAAEQRIFCAMGAV